MKLASFMQVSVSYVAAAKVYAGWYVQQAFQTGGCRCRPGNGNTHDTKCAGEDMCRPTSEQSLCGTPTISSMQHTCCFAPNHCVMGSECWRACPAGLTICRPNSHFAKFACNAAAKSASHKRALTIQATGQQFYTLLRFCPYFGSAQQLCSQLYNAGLGCERSFHK